MWNKVCQSPFHWYIACILGLISLNWTLRLVTLNLIGNVHCLIKSNAVHSCNLLFKMAMYIIRITCSHPWLSMIIHRHRINLRQHVLFGNKWHAFVLNFSRNIGCLTIAVEKLKWKKLSTSFHEKYVNSLPLQMESISKMLAALSMLI